MVALHNKVAAMNHDNLKFQAIKAKSPSSKSNHQVSRQLSLKAPSMLFCNLWLINVDKSYSA